MDFKKTITLLAVMCAFSSFGQELIAPYNMMRGNNVDVIDTVPADEIWKIESIGNSNSHSSRNIIYLNSEVIDINDLKLPFWLNSGDIIELPQDYNSVYSTYIKFISILRFTKPD